jgi:hypothetical protein
VAGGGGAGAGARLNGEATGREGLGGGCAGEGMGETKELTGGAKLLERGRGARGRGRDADGQGPDVSEARGARSWVAWAGERVGEARARGLVGPDSAQPRRGRKVSLFLFFF